MANWFLRSGAVVAGGDGLSESWSLAVRAVLRRRPVSTSNKAPPPSRRDIPRYSPSLSPLQPYDPIHKIPTSRCSSRTAIGLTVIPLSAGYTSIYASRSSRCSNQCIDPIVLHVDERMSGGIDGKDTRLCAITVVVLERGDNRPAYVRVLAGQVLSFALKCSSAAQSIMLKEARCEVFPKSVRRHKKSSARLSSSSF